MSNASAPAVIVLSQPPAVSSEEYYLPADRLISGNPQQRVWLEYADPSSRFSVGVWSSEVGEWHIRYTEEEYCRILEGRSVITDAQGNAVTVVAGSEFAIPAGFSGTWRVEEPTRKRFVIFEESQ